MKKLVMQSSKTGRYIWEEGGEYSITEREDSEPIVDGILAVDIIDLNEALQRVVP